MAAGAVTPNVGAKSGRTARKPTVSPTGLHLATYWVFRLVVDSRPMLVAGGSALREHKAIFVLADQEVSRFQSEISLVCAPLL